MTVLFVIAMALVCLIIDYFVQRRRDKLIMNAQIQNLKNSALKGTYEAIESSDDLSVLEGVNVSEERS